MKLLLTSAGIKNPSIHAAMLDLLGKRIDECDALCIPTASHLDCPVLPENTMADAERWFAGLDVPAYAIDDDTAIVWVDGEIDVVSTTEHWKQFPVAA